MAQRNESHAYDLSLFETKKADVIAVKPNKKLEKAKQRKNKVQSLLNTVAFMFIAVMVISVMCTMISMRVQLIELEGSIRASEEEIVGLESKRIRLTDELAQKTSAKSVEEYARDTLGMQKAESSQIFYIQIEEGDKVIVPETNSDNIFDNAVSSIKSFFGQLAYLFE